VENIRPILATGAIILRDECILIAQRKKSGTIEGLWEFPGGKVEYAESPEECLVREIKEELDCRISIVGLYDVSSHVYPDRRHFVILFYRCKLEEGIPKLLDHNKVKWAGIEELVDYEFVAADRKVVKRIVEEMSK